MLQEPNFLKAAKESHFLKEIGYVIASCFEVYRMDVCGDIEDPNLGEIASFVNKIIAKSKFLEIAKSYSILHLPPMATTQDICAAFKKQSLSWHPDKVCFHKIKWLTMLFSICM